MLFPSNALAWGWLDVVKGIASGIIGQVNTSQTKPVVVQCGTPKSKRNDY
jgi:hypothetical protein